MVSFFIYSSKQGLIFHLNQLLADDSHDISSLVWCLKTEYKLKKKSSAFLDRLRVNEVSVLCSI